jgi:hypothetical protein
MFQESYQYLGLLLSFYFYNYILNNRVYIWALFFYLRVYYQYGANCRNNTYFEGELKKSFPFKISRSRKSLGHILFSRTNLEVKSFSISGKMEWEDKEKVLDETILHEMIHVYEAQVLKEAPNHGKNFLKKMNEINSDGWNVTVRSSEVKPEKKESHYVMYREEKDMIICFLIEKSISPLIEKLKRRWKSSTQKEIFFGKVRHDSSFKISRTRYSLYTIKNEDELEFLTQESASDFTKKVTHAEELDRGLWEAWSKGSAYIIKSEEEPTNITSENVLIDLSYLLKDFYVISFSKLAKIFDKEYLKEILNISEPCDLNDQQILKYSTVHFMYIDGKIHTRIKVRKGYEIMDNPVTVLPVNEDIFLKTYKEDYYPLVIF